MITNFRLNLIIVMMFLSVIDLSATFFYVSKYRAWQPNKPFSLIELNPLLSFLWNKLGLHLGMIVGGIFILTLTYIISREAHWIIVLILFLFLVFALYNHNNNIHLLNKLIEQYPSGSLPVKTFGEVIGNNIT